jgi:hypothetical protein
MSDIPYRIQYLEDSNKEHKNHLEGLEDRQINNADAIHSMEEWRGGVAGSRGAEARLQTVECEIKDLPVIRADLEVVKLVANAKLEGIEGAITGVLNKRDKTVLAYLKAFGPYAATAAAIIVAVWK